MINFKGVGIMTRHKIKATYLRCRGVEPCIRCDRDSGNVMHIVTYDDVKDIKEAEKLLYEDMFRSELDIQNEKYRKKGNYGRIWTMDEFRTSPRHRPLENMLKIGNKKDHLSAQELFDVYRKFYGWRKARFGDVLIVVGAVIYIGCTPHIHERYVLYWTDEAGIRHTGIDKALAQAGVGLPFSGCEKSQYNHRKMMFDRICREKWLDFVEEKLKDYPEFELDRPEPGFKPQLKIDRDFRLSLGDRRALDHAWFRTHGKINALKRKIKDMEDELGEIRDDFEIGVVPADEMDALRERMIVLKNKIADHRSRLSRTEKKSKAIPESIF